MISVQNCLVCGGSNNSTILNIQDFPLILRPISDDAMERILRKGITPTIPLNVVICNDCSHMFLGSRAKKSITDYIYSNLYGNYPSKLKLNIGVEDDNEFLEFFKKAMVDKIPDHARVLEIGCFDGYVLYQLKKMGYNVIGCDPSEEVATAEEYDIPVKHDFYSDNMFPKESFDVVFYRNLIEHVEDPVDFIKSTSGALKRDGYLLIETPNGKYYLDKGLIDPFHIEHLSVFTPSSLARCIENAGLGIEEMLVSTRDLRVICRIPNKDSRFEPYVDDFREISKIVQRFSESWRKNIVELKNILDGIVENGENFALWGTGSFSIKIMSQVPMLTERAEVIIDSDPSKQSLSFYHFKYDKELNARGEKSFPKIKSPEYLVENPVDYVFIMSQFGSEIINTMDSKYGLACKKVLITPETKII